MGIPSGKEIDLEDIRKLIASQRNSLIGLGLGYASGGIAPALAGFQEGSKVDATTQYRLAQIAQHRDAQKRQADQFAIAQKFRENEAGRSQSNADRQFGLQERQFTAGLEGQKVPPGFRPTPTGGLGFIPGGPTDPEYIRQTTEIKQKPREFSVTDIGKLTDEGAKLGDLARFKDSFEDRFGGWRVPALGHAATTAGKLLPEGIVGKDIAGGAAFWQGYERYRSVIRNDLYGAALTKPEIASFERLDQSGHGPGDDPKKPRTSKRNRQERAQAQSQCACCCRV